MRGFSFFKGGPIKGGPGDGVYHFVMWVTVTGCKSVVSHHKSVGGRSQVYNDGRALVGGVTARVRHTRLPPSHHAHVSHKSLA